MPRVNNVPSIRPSAVGPTGPSVSSVGPRGPGPGYVRPEGPRYERGPRGTGPGWGPVASALRPV